MADLTAATIHRESRWTTTVWAEEASFGAGIFPDAAPHAIPGGGLFDGYDVLCDRPGKIRKRGGTTTVGTTSTTAFATVFGRLARGVGGRTYYGGKPGGAVSAIQDSTTGEGTSIIASSGTLGTNAGRPFEHLGFMIFPSQTPGAVSGTIVAGGATYGGSSGFALGTPGGVTITAGDSKITITSPDAVLAAEVGAIFTASNATTTYIGRIERFIDAQHFTVFPRPTSTITTPTSARVDLFYTGIYGLTSAKSIAGAVGCSHQGRVLLGNIVYTKSGKEPELYPYRVYYSLLPDELPSGNGASAAQTGANYLNGDGFEDNNYFDVPSLEPIVALQPFGEGQVLILGTTRAHRLTGQLLTQTTTRSGITYDVHPIPNSVGCLSEQSVQATPAGVVWASADGVYVSDGASVTNLMSGKVAETWRDAMAVPGALVVGSALVRNHYIVFTNGYHYCCNLATRAWTRLFGAGIRCFYSATDPTDPTKVYGLRYWTGSPPTFTNGCLMRLDAIFAPTSTNKADVDGTNVNGIIITRSLAGGDPVGVKNFTRDQVQYATPQANATVDRTIVSPADAAWTSLGTLPLTSARADYTFGMGLTSVQRGVSAAYRIQTGACDSFELYAIKTAFQPDQSGVSV